jgi:hypothetical protein
METAPLRHWLTQPTATSSLALLLLPLRPLLKDIEELLAEKLLVPENKMYYLLNFFLTSKQRLSTKRRANTMVLKFFSSKDSKGVYLASIEPKLFAEVHISQIWNQT